MAYQADEGFQDAFTRTFQQFFGITHIDEATRDDIGAGQGLAGFFIDGEDHHQYAILGEHLAVAQDDLSDISDAQAVYKDVATGYMVGDLEGLWSDFDNISILGDDDMVGGNFHGVSQLGMQDELAVFAVNRHKELRVEQGQHQFQLFLGTMS